VKRVEPLSMLCTAITLLAGTSLPVFLDGLERKLKAALQSRIGPPITQTLYDLLKLMIKESKQVHTVPYIILYFTSFISCALTSMFLITLYTITWDFMLFALALSLLMVSLTALTLIPLLIPNPFSYIGGMREVVLSLVNESAFVASVAIYIVSLHFKAGFSTPSTPHLLVVTIPALAIMFTSGYALTGRPPFDIAEAEPELASGVLVEFSGALLALYLYSNLLKRFLVKLFVATMLVTLIAGNGVLSVVLTCLITITLWILFTVISVTLGRSRVDLAPRTLAKYYIGLFIIPIAGLVVLAYG